MRINAISTAWRVIGLSSDVPGNNQRCGLQFGTNFGTSRGALRRASAINVGDSSGFAADRQECGQVERVEADSAILRAALEVELKKNEHERDENYDVMADIWE
jgi:hypothetical protein